MPIGLQPVAGTFGNRALEPQGLGDWPGFAHGASREKVVHGGRAGDEGSALHRCIKTTEDGQGQAGESGEQSDDASNKRRATQRPRGQAAKPLATPNSSLVDALPGADQAWVPATDRGLGERHDHNG
jgi:hypothetical protein